ncbi:MAG: SNF2-related protein [bacterium]
MTPYHAKYFAYELTKRSSSNNLEKLTSTLSNAQVDLNPHQINAALFAFRSPLSKGAILADEVGLGKTIEAGIVLSQKWAEKKRKILLIVPSSLRKQWSSELIEKFFLPSVILETKSFNESIKRGRLNPFDQEEIVICSYQFARNKASYLQNTKWDLVVIDEAHRLRNVYKTSNKIAKDIKNALKDSPKILLTATPLQNSLLELYGLVSIIDDQIFGDLNSFKQNYASNFNYPKRELYSDTNEQAGEIGLLVTPSADAFEDLKQRLNTVCIRTLRKQVLEYIKYTKRISITQDYIAKEDEIELYNLVTEYLQRTKLYALPSSQRQLMTLILRKLLASSSFAIANTLKGLVYKLDKLIEDIKEKESKEKPELEILQDDYDTYDELKDEWGEENIFEEEKTIYTEEDIQLMVAEKKDLEKFCEIAKNIWTNSKGEALLIAIETGFKKTLELGAPRKAIIFTESRITQDYLLKLLSENGYQDKVVLFNGTNNDDKSKEIFQQWSIRNQDTDKISGSKSADLRASIVEYFKDTAEIMIATEAAAEGANLQFCSLVVNYDLPWNPQRIEQRIGRCHRYGQKHDVVVVNFVNRKNAADLRVFELLSEKFSLFKGVFGASDEVLGVIESGVDFEKRIASIYQKCRSESEINSAFDELQDEMDSQIKEGLTDARQKLLEHFDTDVHEKLKTSLSESKENLDRFEKWLWDVTRYYLNDNAIFNDRDFSFTLKNNPFSNLIIDLGPYKLGKNIENSHIYRPSHELAQNILSRTKTLDLNSVKVTFNYSNNPFKVSVIEQLVGKEGVLRLSNFTVEALESEDYILASALMDDGDIIEDDIIKKLFLIKETVVENTEITTEETSKLEELENGYINKSLEMIIERNSTFFDEEVNKLDKWADDMKKSLELDLKRLDIEIKTVKTNAKKILILEQKVSKQREIKEMEKKRNMMRMKLYEAQDAIDEKKEELLSKTESKLKQTKTLTNIFTIRFKVI